MQIECEKNENSLKLIKQLQGTTFNSENAVCANAMLEVPISIPDISPIHYKCVRVSGNPESSSNLYLWSSGK